MGILRTEFTRFFAIGFVAGALLVLGTVGIGGAERIVHGVIPTAAAAPAAVPASGE